MSAPAVVKVHAPAAAGGAWKVHGRGMQNLRLVPDKQVPQIVRDAMRGDRLAFFHAVWDRSRGLWLMGERAPGQGW